MKMTMDDLRRASEKYLHQMDKERKIIYRLFPDLKPKERKPMSTQARLNISKARKLYFKKLHGDWKVK